MNNDRITAILRWIEEKAAAAHGLLVPISGGSDSALCFWLCNQVCPSRTFGVYFGETLRCRRWFEEQGSIEILPPPAGQTSREREVHRWAILLDKGLMELRWLVGSRNRTEIEFGTYSLASRLATFLPLAGVWKTTVMSLCETAGVPREITDSSRQADPGCERPKKMAEIGLELIDLFLQVKVGELPPSHLSALTEGQNSYLEGIYEYTLFKKSLPICGPTV